MDPSLVLESFFSKSRIPSNVAFKLSFIVVLFRMVHDKKLFRRSSVKVKLEVVHFSYEVKEWKAAGNCPKIVAYTIKNREISGPYNFWTPVKNNIPGVWNWNCWTFLSSWIEMEGGGHSPPCLLPFPSGYTPVVKKKDLCWLNLVQ